MLVVWDMIEKANSTMDFGIVQALMNRTTHENDKITTYGIAVVTWWVVGLEKNLGVAFHFVTGPPLITIVLCCLMAMSNMPYLTYIYNLSRYVKIVVNVTHVLLIFSELHITLCIQQSLYLWVPRDRTSPSVMDVSYPSQKQDITVFICLRKSPIFHHGLMEYLGTNLLYLVLRLSI